MDDFFLVTMSLIIFFLQGGFAFLEAGSVRSKNTTNILIKNLIDFFVSGLSYWLFGYTLAYGEGNGFIGYQADLLAHYNLPTAKYSYWLFQYVFAATAATIVSGAVAERCDFNGYLVYSFLITGFVYPVVSRWAWSPQGWLLNGATYMDENGGEFVVAYTDFAGSGALHSLSGAAAFIGALVVGPRIGRFDPDTGEANHIKGHSVPFAALGGFILLFGFLAFNGGSLGSISNPGDGAIIASVVVNTIVAGTGGAFITLLLNKTGWFGDRKWSLLVTLNGCLTGMVSVCAGVNDLYTWSSFVIGTLGGIVYMVSSWTVVKLRVDDPLDATAVHLGGGLFGVFMVTFFSKSHGILYFWNRKSGLHLAWQLAGISAILGWTIVLSFIIFFALKKLNMLRVDEEMEIKGLDIPKHGEPSYPAEAYGHGWGEQHDHLAFLAGTSVLGKSQVDTVMTKRSNNRSTGNPEMDALRTLDKESSSSKDSGINKDHHVISSL
ncbi:putative ammonium transporter 1 [Liolophura sinensis]|uniref:putative ammonium transporter 1 n=1 Tax=Liolophura sinensis TaxID=3198878 RepID=UPI00315850E5